MQSVKKSKGVTMLMSDTPRIEMSHETREKLRRDNVDLLGVVKKVKPDTKAFREILDEEIKKRTPQPSN